ncbi:MAG TPA: phosphatidylserine decarboxylase family protein [Bacteroidetes bacterium]|nr:phosphatidylserine decarboxylase family protein [Bacteroidota bacterium]
MRIHREGKVIIPVSFLILATVWSAVYFPLLRHTPVWWLGMILGFAAMILFGFILNFFRDPEIKIETDPRGVIAPADGKIVVIEEVHEPLFFKGPAIQVSIFMSPLNVHVNRNPISGKLVMQKYFPGKFLVAYHPKSSTENEQTFFAIQNERWGVAFKQIAGAVARRIRWYVKEGDQVEQSQEMGFIRFGSRIDILIPKDAEIKVELDEMVRGGITLIALAKADPKFDKQAK